MITGGGIGYEAVKDVVEGGEYVVEKVFCANRNRVELIRLADGRRLVLKRFKRPNVINRLAYRWLRGSKARRSYEHSARLRALGFDSPAPFAWADYRAAGQVVGGWYASEYVDAPTLGDMVPWSEIGRLDYAMRYEREFRDFPPFAVKLMRSGVRQKDFNRANFLVVKKADGTPAYSMVDVNRVSFGKTPTAVAIADSWRRFGCNKRLTMRFTLLTAEELGISIGRVRAGLKKHFRRMGLRSAFKEFKRKLRNP